MHGQDEYLDSKVMTASPYDLHLMVIDGAIRHATQAEQAMTDEDYEAAHLALSDSRGFVGELISGLDEEQAPELVDPLKGLFVFAFRNLVEADLDRDIAKVRDALVVLRSHRETWLELADALSRVQHEDDSTGGPPSPHIVTTKSDDSGGRSWSS